MLRLSRERKPASIDINHMRVLHEEAIEQLELMKTALDTREEATGTLRDNLENIVLNHWHAYMDIIHMIALHDELMADALKKYGLTIRDGTDAETDERYAGPLLLSLLLLALIRRHRRIWHIYGWRANPMGDYLKESLTMEREHVAEIISMAETML